MTELDKWAMEYSGRPMCGLCIYYKENIINGTRQGSCSQKIVGIPWDGKPCSSYKTCADVKENEQHKLKGKCTCGAVYTRNPSQHTDWCDIKR